MWNSGGVDEATWAALAATLTLLGLVWTWVSFRRRGTVSAMRAFGFTLLPVAAFLTGTLEMFTEIAGSVTDWATGLVLSPVTWAGIGLGGLGVVLIVLAGVLRDRQLGRAVDGSSAAEVDSGRAARRGPLPEASSTRAPRQEPVVDDEMAEIEALLKKRGIQ
jgi:hypothetical protein